MAVRAFLRKLGAALRRDTPAFTDSALLSSRGARLARVDLHDAVLPQADLRGADLQDADLRHADLHEANLRRADLRGADLEGTDLVNAQMAKVRLSRSTYDDATKWPPSLADSIHRRSTELQPGVFQVTEDFVAP